MKSESVDQHPAKVNLLEPNGRQQNHHGPLQFIPSVLLVNERPGAQGPSKSLLEFTKARFIRLRFQKLQTLAIDQSILGKYAAAYQKLQSHIILLT